MVAVATVLVSLIGLRLMESKRQREAISEFIQFFEKKGMKITGCALADKDAVRETSDLILGQLMLVTWPAKCEKIRLNCDVAPGVRFSDDQVECCTELLKPLLDIEEDKNFQDLLQRLDFSIFDLPRTSCDLWEAEIAKTGKPASKANFRSITPPTPRKRF